MKISYRAAAAALAFSCLFAGGAAGAADRDTFQVHVSAGGLDLATANGRAAFDARVHRIANYACGAHGRGLADQRERDRCVGEMRADANRQLALRFADKGVRIASATR